MVLLISRISRPTSSIVNTSGCSDWQTIREGGRRRLSSAMLTHEYQRWAALIAMDSRGRVPMGNVEPELNKRSEEFHRRRTDGDALGRNT